MKDTMACDEFEVQIEMRLHGALPAADALEGHLATCAGCRAFQELAKSTEKTMTAVASAEAQRIDWTKLRDRVARRLDRDTRWRVGTFAAVFVAQAGAMLAFNEARLWSRILPNFAFLCLGAIAFLAVSAFFRRRRMREYETSTDDLLFFERAYILERLSRTHVAGIALVPLGAAYVVVRLLQVHHRVISITEWLAAGAMTTIILGIAGWLLFVVRPRLERELDAFKKR